uniref:Uncharacterized protein n=1 Tax=Arundo donax TaxID=35708 RepID=A0A0A9FJV3_ARUDO
MNCIMKSELFLINLICNDELNS